MPPSRGPGPTPLSAGGRPQRPRPKSYSARGANRSVQSQQHNSSGLSARKRQDESLNLEDSIDWSLFGLDDRLPGDTGRGRDDEGSSLQGHPYSFGPGTPAGGGAAAAQALLPTTAPTPPPFGPGSGLGLARPRTSPAAPGSRPNRPGDKMAAGGRPSSRLYSPTPTPSMAASTAVPETVRPASSLSTPFAESLLGDVVLGRMTPTPAAMSASPRRPASRAQAPMNVKTYPPPPRSSSSSSRVSAPAGTGIAMAVKSFQGRTIGGWLSPSPPPSPAPSPSPSPAPWPWPEDGDGVEEEALALTQLLAALGVDYRKPTGDHLVPLPLEAFEDTSMWLRSPEDWQALMAAGPNGFRRSLPCVALRLIDRGTGTWRKAACRWWDEAQQKYQLSWLDGSEARVSNLHVFFLSDDRRLFAARLAKALQQRRRAHDLLKYNLFVDSMPRDPNQRIHMQAINRIANLAHCTLKIAKEDFEGASIVRTTLQGLIEELQQSFARTQNAMVFERVVMKQGDVGALLVDMVIPPPPPPQPVPESAVLAKETWESLGEAPDPEIPVLFEACFEGFCEASLLTRPELVVAQQLTSGLCDDLFAECAWDLVLTAQCPADFGDHQDAALARFKGKLMMWVTTVRNRIVDCLNKASVKWHNVNETNLDTYLSSRLRSLMLRVRLEMANAARLLGEDNLEQYVRIVEETVPTQFELGIGREALKATRNWFAVPEGGDREMPLGCKPQLLRLELRQSDPPPVEEEPVESTSPRGSMKLTGSKIGITKTAMQLPSLSKGGKVMSRSSTLMAKASEDAASDVDEDSSYRHFCFDISVEEVEKIVVDSFHKGVAAFQDVHSVESILLPHLIRDKCLDPSFSAESDWIVKLQERLQAAVQTHGPWLESIIEYLQEFADVAQLDPEAVLQEVETQGGKTNEMIKEQVEAYLERQRCIAEVFPDENSEIVVGFFCIRCAAVRHTLIEKLEVAANCLMKHLAEKLTEESSVASQCYSEVYDKLSAEVLTIEDCAAMRQLIKTVPTELAKIKLKVDDVMTLADVLADLRYALPAETENAKWEMYGAAGRVRGRVVKAEEYLSSKEREFLTVQETEQRGFRRRLYKLEEVVEDFAQHTDFKNVLDISARARETHQEISTCQELAKLYNSREVLFEKDPTDYSLLGTIAKTFEPFYNLWRIAGDWAVNKEKWLQGPFGKIDPDYCETETITGIKLLFKTSRVMKEREETKPLVALADQVRMELESFKPFLPLVTGLRNEGMKARHWDEVSRISNVAALGPHMGDDFRLEKFVELGLLKCAKEIVDIGDRAGKEYSLEKALLKMRMAWEPLRFDFSEKYRKTQTYILKGDGEAMGLLDEHIVETQAMMFSAFKGPFEAEIDEWNARLMRVSETLEEWLKVQKSWMYLQPIFDSEDIMRQLPAEAKRFRSVDQTWRQEMTAARENPKIIDICAVEGLLEKWQDCTYYLEVVQKGLEDYLETKRNAFARFFFLSNDELLEILSQTKDPTRVQPFLTKVFEAMSKVTFAKGGFIEEMISPEGETITFTEPIETGPNVEVWMSELEEGMCTAIRAEMEQGIRCYVGGGMRSRWVLAFPAQIVINASQVHWTTETEAAFDENTMASHASYLSEQILGLIMLLRRGPSKLQKTTIGALVVIDVHAKDIVQGFAEKNIFSKDSFEWLSQLRYYWQWDDRGKEHLWVKCVQTSFPYGYEYLGNSMRLVITPLTDLCYITLMGAQALNLGGAPAGPAGTGKTETTKDLAKALAKQCVVFNCSPEMDYIMVGKFFKGLAFSGAWCCFDEFNRINIEVLSVVAQQLLVLFGKKAELLSYNDVAELEFEGTNIVMKPTFNVFITMNPGYAGRAELPDNLAALFRPVAMMVPDYALIGEIMFYAYGFTEAKILAKKMVTTFTLSSEQLSSQFHYDYGMRAVKSTIEMCGKLKRELEDSMEEDQITLRALRDVNVPKFLKDDLPLFENIISDLFPTTERPEVDYGRLKPALGSQCKAQGLQLTESFAVKVVQLLDTIGVRHGLMLVGPTGGGKTSSYRLLQSTCCDLCEQGDSKYQKVQTRVLNPKAVTQAQLYGAFDEITREWRDGVAAQQVREAVAAGRDGSPDGQWVVFDGPVDALWIESMNTVLDDNRKLCLTSGEIIALTPQMRMIFEVEDLSVASPATVSRCGMVYMEPGALGLEPLLESWLRRLPSMFPESYSNTFRSHFQTFAVPMITFVRKQTKELTPTVDNALCQSHFRLIDCFLVRYRPTEISAVTPAEIEAFEAYLTPLFFFTLVWSIGATCDNEGRRLFSDQLWSLLKAEAEEEEEKELEVGGIQPPSPGSSWYSYAFCMSGDQSGQWIPWTEFWPPYSVPTDAEYQKIVVPTEDSIRLTRTFSMLLTNNSHVIVAGNTGTGKSVYVTLWAQKDAPETVLPIFINFSAQTHVNQFQDLLDSKFEKRRRGVFGPAAGKRNVIFVDDLNMPKKEFWGAQPPLELLRQWHDHGGWYDRTDLYMQDIIDIVHVSAMGPAGGGRTEISGRLKRHYNIVVAADMSRESIERIFSTILGYFLDKGFDDATKALSDSLVSFTVDIFQAVGDELLPTPQKSHYSFNLRDIWKVFQGICSLTAKTVAQPITMARCLCHENLRVYGDRLVDEKDRSWLKERLEVGVSNRLGLSIDHVFHTERLIFGSFIDTGAAERSYIEIEDLQMLKSTIEQMLDDYNNINTSPMNLVMFMDACEHVARICRILQQPGGNALLLGVGGSGRQSLARLASFMTQLETSQIEVTKGYGLTEFKEDLKKCLMQCGTSLTATTFVFADTQIVDEQMVEAINNVLNSGDVPNIYKTEDMDTILQTCRSACQNEGLPTTKGNVFSTYLSRVKSRVHMALAFSPVGDVFRNRLRMFPSLVNCCTIDWFAEWPGEALYSVGKQQMTQDEDLDLPNLEGVLNLFKVQHRSVEAAAKDVAIVAKRYIYVTPTSFLELVSSFKKILALRREAVGTLRSRLQGGLDALAAASEAVATMEKELTANQPILEETKKEVASMMVAIVDDKAKADVTRGQCMEVEAKVQGQADEAAAIKEDAQRDLDEALPALNIAEKALKAVKLSALQEIKSLTAPPPGVKLTMEGLCVMFQIKPLKRVDAKDPRIKYDDYWEAARTGPLSDPKKMMDDLLEFDKDHIPDSVIAKITPYLDREDFDPAVIKKASSACEALCLWTRAMHKYHFIAKAVEPKRQLLKEAESNLAAAQGELAAAQGELRKVEEKIAQLEANYDAAVKRQEQLTHEMELCEIKLGNATKLIEGLGGERERWEVTVEKLTLQMQLLPGDAAIAAGMVSYAGPFAGQHRQYFEKLWRDTEESEHIASQPDVSLIKVLGSPEEVLQWSVYGLPNDDLSVENGIVIATARRWPLMIDPQRQANKFIKNYGKEASEQGMVICKLSDSNLLQIVELGVQFGKWVMLENIAESIDPALEPILQQQKVKDGSFWKIRLNDKEVAYSSQFRFFITTTLSNPHFSPELSVKVTLLNFAITQAGLQDQMLATVVALEQPQMEAKRQELTRSNARNTQELKDIEDNILRLLSAGGDILASRDLIDALETSKVTSSTIGRAMQEAEEMQVGIDEVRRSYRPYAFRASLLFFCLSELMVIDPMYQFSLQWFQQLASMGVANAEQGDSPGARLDHLINYITYSIYQSVCRGLFEKHKMLFSFALALRLLEGADMLNVEECRFLLTGPTSDIKDANLSNPAASWLSDKAWSDILSLTQLKGMEGFSTSFAEHARAWRAVYDAEQAENEIFPTDQDLKPMQRLCILRILRPDRLSSAITQFVIEELGEKFVEPPAFDVATSFADSSKATPLIFLLSPGSDPVNDLLEFAQSLNAVQKLDSISLGQGQGPKAATMIDRARTSGSWVLLCNCHLCISWLPELERICEQMNPETTSESYRLWLTSMPTSHFPALLLQNGVKMTNEPPKGLRANVMGSMLKCDDRMLNDCTQPDAFARLLFAFCFFHAICQDRRRFGAIGWNTPYNFTPEDLTTNRRQLKYFLDNYEDVPYEVLRFLGAQINYGGRVTDKKDKVLIESMISIFICREVVEDGPDYKFSPSGLFYCPEAASQEDFLRYLKTLPITTPPEVFGLHSNCEITCAEAESMALLQDVLAVRSVGDTAGASGGDGAPVQSKEDVMYELAGKILAETPTEMNLDDFEEAFPTKYEESRNTVVKQEAGKYNQLLSVLRSQLPMFRKAVKGLVVMTEDLETVGRGLYSNSVPQAWSAVGFLSMKPLMAWHKDLNERVAFMRSWLEDGHPSVFWLSGIFFPQAFFTAVMQNYARANRYAIDRIDFDIEVRDDCKVDEGDLLVPAPTGCYIHGFFLEGCRWSYQKHCLTYPKPKELFSQLPAVHFKPELDWKTRSGVFACPIYKVLSRSGTLMTTGHSTNFVRDLALPSNEDPGVWIRAGAAAFLALRY